MLIIKIIIKKNNNVNNNKVNNHSSGRTMSGYGNLLLIYFTTEGCYVLPHPVLPHPTHLPAQEIQQFSVNATSESFHSLGH